MHAKVATSYVSVTRLGSTQHIAIQPAPNISPRDTSIEITSDTEKGLRAMPRSGDVLTRSEAFSRLTAADTNDDVETNLETKKITHL